MAYIAPNTYVKLYKGVDIDPDYNHTIRFDNAQQQKDWFNNKYGGTQIEFNNQSYQRFERGRLKLQTPIEPVLQCNYMVFGNSSFENKQFYAFVTSVEYSSNNVTIIEYEIDVMQTWMFDYTIDDVFVEREHSATDEIGDNIVPEPVGVSGELIEQRTTDVKFKCLLGGIITSKPLPYELTTMTNIDGGRTSWIKIKYPSDKLVTYCGIPNGCYIYEGFILEKNDFVNRFYKTFTPQLSDDELIEKYTLQDPRNYGTAGVDIATLSNVINSIVRGFDFGISEDIIVATFTYPVELGEKTQRNNTENIYGYRNGMFLSEIVSLPFESVNTISYNGDLFTPKNKKMWTHPYTQIQVSNLNGNVIELKPQDFENNNIYFRYLGNVMNGCNIVLFPINHKGISNDYDSGTYCSNFPEALYKGDAFAQWMNRNKFGMLFGAVSSMLGTVSYTYKPKSTTTYMRKGKEVTRTNRAQHKVKTSGSAIETVLGAIGTFMDLQNVAPTAYGHTEFSDVLVGINSKGFEIRLLTLKPSIARTIDNYFTMFGYATNLVKEPNYLSSSKRRPTFNYIKTANMHLSNQKLPADAIEQICEIYDKGITFWERIVEVGNYDIPNNPPQ